jgi:hypothetical protein
MGSERPNRARSRFLFAALVIGASVLGCDRDDADWTAAKIEQSKQIGDRLIASIQQYHRQHKRYPAALSDLFPGSPEQLPQPVAGTKRWVYEHDHAKHHFYLSFEEHHKWPARYGRGKQADWGYDSGR